MTLIKSNHFGLKQCIKCGKWKSLSEFHRHEASPDGYRSACKVCIKTYGEEYRKRNKDKLEKYGKEWREKNKEKKKAADKAYYEANKEEFLRKSAERYQANKEKISKKEKEKLKEYRKKHGYIMRGGKVLLNLSPYRICSQCCELRDKKDMRSRGFHPEHICKFCKNAQARERHQIFPKHPPQMEGEQTCTCCNKIKDIQDFYANSKCKNGRDTQCKECANKKGKARRDKLNYPRQEEGVKVCNTCKVEKDVSDYTSNSKNKDGLMASCNECRNKAARKRNRAKNYQYYIDRYHEDLEYKLAMILRTRLGHAIKNKQKRGSAVKDLGCNISELKKYLESQFYPNPKTGEEMIWENWSRDGWHIDHKIPLSSFNLEDREEFKKACHFSNLQPLWAEENLRKGNKVKNA